jgi:hypothetical protein
VFAQLVRRTLPFVSEHLFEKSAAKPPICRGVATDASERIDPNIDVDSLDIATPLTFSVDVNRIEKRAVNQLAEFSSSPARDVRDVVFINLAALHMRCSLAEGSIDAIADRNRLAVSVFEPLRHVEH